MKYYFCVILALTAVCFGIFVFASMRIDAEKAHALEVAKLPPEQRAAYEHLLAEPSAPPLVNRVVVTETIVKDNAPKEGSVNIRDSDGTADVHSFCWKNQKYWFFAYGNASWGVLQLDIGGKPLVCGKAAE
jgi:hypothetical protein